MIALPSVKHRLIQSSAALCLFVLLLSACKEKGKKDVQAPEATTPAPVTGSFINPPIKSADVPYEEYEVDAAKGDTLLYPSGSIILFPPNAFVDEAGKPVTGKVQVKYREFNDPLDFFLAGIPMQYDSAGTAYQLVSSGMLDIRAFKDGKPVFVNKAAKPEINLASKTNSDKHSIYYLDTVQKKWINKGSMEITETRGQKKTAAQATAVPAPNDMPEPVKPLKAAGKSPVLKIEVDPSSFKEFAIYKNLKFQVDESKTPFNVKDSEEEWNNLELLKGAQPGTYMAKFSNAAKSVTYAVKPVLEGAEYDKALKVFEKEYAEYKKKADERAANDRLARVRYLRDSIRNDRFNEEIKKIERLNAIIAQKNREIEKQNEKIEKENLEIEKQNAITVKKKLEAEKRTKEYGQRMTEMEKENEKRRLEEEKENEKRRIAWEKQREINKREEKKFAATMATLGDVYRSFQIDGFGYWNCDIATKQKTISITATFKDEKGNELQLGYVTVINRSVNSIYRVNFDNELLLVPTAENMLLAVYNNQFVYVSYDEFKKLNITDDTKEQTFIVKIVEENDLNYRYIRNLIKQY
jgi:hypothetical protein